MPRKTGIGIGSSNSTAKSSASISPLIRRQDVKGFVRRKPVWLVRPLGLAAVRKQVELMELETKRFYESAGRKAADAGIRQLLGDLAEEEAQASLLAEELETPSSLPVDGRRGSNAETTVPAPGDPARPGRADGRLRVDAGAALRRRFRHPQ